tara:strand:+ start:983 stop:1294 length:312 start_codon:yes stop_codon:yes gene_type:complete
MAEAYPSTTEYVAARKVWEKSLWTAEFVIIAAVVDVDFGRRDNGRVAEVGDGLLVLRKSVAAGLLLGRFISFFLVLAVFFDHFIPLHCSTVIVIISAPPTATK